jgi:hypothetical protein
MRMLNDVEGVQIRGENRNALFELYKAIDAVRQTENRFGTVRRSIDDPWYGADKVSADGFEQTCLESFVSDVLAPSSSTMVLGFKEIGHLPNRMTEEEFQSYISFILDKFPQATIVFNTRDARSVARSGWFRDMDPDYVVQEVEEADRRFRVVAEAEPLCHMIDYSEIVSLDDKLRDLYAKIGLDFDEGVARRTLDTPLNHMKGPALVNWGRKTVKSLLLGRR